MGIPYYKILARRYRYKEYIAEGVRKYKEAKQKKYDYVYELRCKGIPYSMIQLYWVNEYHSDPPEIWKLRNMATIEKRKRLKTN